VLVAVDDGGKAALLQAAGQMISTIGQLTAALDAVAVKFQQATSALPNAADLASFAATFVERILAIERRRQRGNCRHPF